MQNRMMYLGIQYLQMHFKAIKYLSPISIYAMAIMAFTQNGILTWTPLLYAWVLLPLLELILPPDTKNMNAAEEELAKKDPLYDYLLYIIVPFQFAALYMFLSGIAVDKLYWWETWGRVWTMGLLCGTFGINVGHELGHRVNKMEQWFAKALLTTSLYQHFFIEHNKGHHKNVATPQDPSSARYNEIIYFFYFRTIVFSYLSAWKIANSEQIKKGLPKWNFGNEMIQAHIIQTLFTAIIFWYFGWQAGLYFIAAAFIGITLLETVNYIEHYGLQRKETAPGKYERTLARHSWNSNHPLGRIMLLN
jgi:alkane 1-monooxygenase